jgi:molecular chaperone DnaJ
MTENGVGSYQEIIYIINESDPYKILGINDDAELHVINAAYREFAKKYHPDLFVHLTNKEQLKEIDYIFSKITGAFNKLKDQETRNKFDHEKKLKQTISQSSEDNSNPFINIKSTTPGRVNLNDVEKYSGIDIKNRKSNEAESYFNLGVSCLNKNNLEEAQNNFQTAIKIDAKIARYHSYLALVMREKGWEGYAQAEFKVALHYDPNDKTARENLLTPEEQPKTENKPAKKKHSFFNNITSKFFKKK